MSARGGGAGGSGTPERSPSKGRGRGRGTKKDKEAEAIAKRAEGLSVKDDEEKKTVKVIKREEYEEMKRSRKLVAELKLYGSQGIKGGKIGNKVNVLANHFGIRVGGKGQSKVWQYDAKFYRMRGVEAARRVEGAADIDKIKEFSTMRNKEGALEPQLSKEVFWKVVEKHRDVFGNPFQIIYDGKSLVYTLTPIGKGVKEPRFVFVIKTTTYDDCKEQTFGVLLTLVDPNGVEFTLDETRMSSGRMDIQDLLEYSRSTLQILDILIRQSRSCPSYPPSAKFYADRSRVFLIPNPRDPIVDLGKGLQHWMGSHQGHHVIQDGTIALNFDVNNSAFFKPQYFVEYLSDCLKSVAKGGPRDWWMSAGNIQGGLDGTDIIKGYPGGLKKDMEAFKIGKMPNKLVKTANPLGMKIKVEYWDNKKGVSNMFVRRFKSISEHPASQTKFAMFPDKAKELGLSVPTAVEQTYETEKRVARGQKIKDFTPMNSVQVSVAEYYFLKYGIELRYPLLPPVSVKSQRRGQEMYFPMEFCWVYQPQRFSGELSPDQLAIIIKGAAMPAVDGNRSRKAKIEELIRTSEFNNDPWLKEFQFQITPNMMKMEGRVLPTPTLIYSNGRTTPKDGSWKMPPGSKFFEGANIHHFGIMSVAIGAQQERRLVENFPNNFVGDVNPFGLKMSRFTDIGEHVEGKEHIKAGLVKLKGQIEAKNNQDGRGKDCPFIFVVLPKKSAELYSEVKRVAEIELGIMTQCLLIKTVRGYKRMTGENIALKVNMKMGGLNWKMEPSALVPGFPRAGGWKEQRLMVVGVDVVHPAVVRKSGDVKEKRNVFPSIAAIVANRDAEFKIFKSEVKVQLKRMEYVRYLQDAIRKHIFNYHETNGFLPERIVVYRDGVADSMFYEVVTEEVASIQDSMGKVQSEPKYDPKITYIICNKRHHTRFFPADERSACGRAKNVAPGMTVDSTITTPCSAEFYQVAHFGIQGTSRPIKYNVVYNDDDLSMDFIESFTFHMTHIFERSPRSVSLPAPLYYADLLCERAHCHLKDQSVSASATTMSMKGDDGGTKGGGKGSSQGKPDKRTEMGLSLGASTKTGKLKADTKMVEEQLAKTSSSDDDATGQATSSSSAEERSGSGSGTRVTGKGKHTIARHQVVKGKGSKGTPKGKGELAKRMAESEKGSSKGSSGPEETKQETGTATGGATEKTEAEQAQQDKMDDTEWMSHLIVKEIVYDTGLFYI